MELESNDGWLGQSAAVPQIARKPGAPLRFAPATQKQLPPKSNFPTKPIFPQQSREVNVQQNNVIRVEALRRQIARLEDPRPHAQRPTVLSGCGPLDGLLPSGGMCRGTLVEWLAAGEGNGATTLALLTAREASRDGGAVVVIDPRREFYPPAAVRLGIAPGDLIVVHAVAEADATWALDQSLRCPAVAAALAWPQRHSEKRELDAHTLRRWQLAAEGSGALGLLIRPEAARHEPSWADVRLLVEPLPAGRGRPAGGRRRLRIHLLRCRGTAAGRSVDVELDDETHLVYPLAQLADPAPDRRAAGA